MADLDNGHREADARVAQPLALRTSADDDSEAVFQRFP
jgi:hypothetical protein